MKTEIMRFLDEKIGIPFCFFLLPFASKKQNKKLNKSIKRVLIIKFFGLGSIILVAPTLREIKNNFPNAKIYFLTFKNNLSICKMIPEIDEIITMTAEKLPNFLLNFIKLIKKLRTEKFDLIFDLEFFANFSAIVTFLSQPAYSVGFESFKFWRQKLYSESVVFDHGKHAVDNFLRTLEAVLDKKIDGRKIQKLFISKKERNYVKNTFQMYKIKVSDYLVIIYPSAGSLCINRMWPMNYFISLIKNLIDYKKNIKIILVGGSKESDYNQKVINFLSKKYLNNLVNLAGNTIGEQAAITQKAKLFIGSDSGPFHIAEAVGTPTVSFFGPETPSLYGPISDNHTVFYADLPCSPCLNIYNSKRYICHDNRCLKAIKPKIVFEIVKEKYLK